MNKPVERGQLVKLEFEDREFEAIVIDPNGLGHNQASVGFGLAMMERYGGLPNNTSSQWLQGSPNTQEECLKAPSGKTFRVLRILGEDNNQYVVLEVSDWVSLAASASSNFQLIARSRRCRSGIRQSLGN